MHMYVCRYVYRHCFTNVPILAFRFQMDVFVKTANTWLDSHIRFFISKYKPEATFHDTLEGFPKDSQFAFQLCDGTRLGPHFAILNNARCGLLSAYPNSDALSRKSFLAESIERWTAKWPASILKRHSPTTVQLSLDYSEFVDDALTQTDLTLMRTLVENDSKPASDRE